MTDYVASLAFHTQKTCQAVIRPAGHQARRAAHVVNVKLVSASDPSRTLFASAQSYVVAGASSAVVHLNGALGRLNGFSDGEEILVSRLAELVALSDVSVTAASAEDYEMAALNAERLSAGLLSQVSVLGPGMGVPAWLDNVALALRVAELRPAGLPCGRLGDGTLLTIRPPEPRAPTPLAVHTETTRRPPSPTPPKPKAPFVQLPELESMMGEAVSFVCRSLDASPFGRGHLLLNGELGSGKSAVATEIARRVAAEAFVETASLNLRAFRGKKPETLEKELERLTSACGLLVLDDVDAIVSLAAPDQLKGPDIATARLALRSDILCVAPASQHSFKSSKKRVESVS